MKKTIHKRVIFWVVLNITGLCLIAAGLYTITASNTKQEASEPEPLFGTAITTIHDFTNREAHKPDAEHIIGTFGFWNDPWQGAWFRRTTITDVAYNKVFQTALPSANKWYSNEFKRQKDVIYFQEEVRDAVEDTIDASGRDFSEVFLTISRELNLLASIPAKRKTAVIFSDLMENNSIISFYKQKYFNLLESDPEAIQDILSKQEELNDLSGVEVFFVFEAKDQFESEQFKTVAGFYRSMLEAKGAKVHIGANLTNL